LSLPEIVVLTGGIPFRFAESKGLSLARFAEAAEFTEKAQEG